MTRSSPFLTGDFGVGLERGVLSSRGEVRNSAGVYAISGSGRIADLSVCGVGGQERFGAKLAEFAEFMVSRKSSAVRIETLALTEPRLRLEILESGEWNFEENENQPVVEFRPAPSRSWEIDAIDITSGVIEFIDHSSFRPVALTANQLEGS